MVFCDHSPQKYVKGKTTYGKGPISFDFGRIESSILPMLSLLLHPNQSKLLYFQKWKLHLVLKLNQPMVLNPQETSQNLSAHH
jgi:hypothetical protein